jgi:hypothetical protein
MHCMTAFHMEHSHTATESLTQCGVIETVIVYFPGLSFIKAGCMVWPRSLIKALGKLSALKGLPARSIVPGRPASNNEFGKGDKNAFGRGS